MKFLTRTQVAWVFVTIVALRFAIGFHFFQEGTDKLKSGNWSAAPFFRAAKGPWAHHFHAMLDDPDGEQLLCIVRPESADSSPVPAATNFNDADQDLPPELSQLQFSQSGDSVAPVRMATIASPPSDGDWRSAENQSAGISSPSQVRTRPSLTLTGHSSSPVVSPTVLDVPTEAVAGKLAVAELQISPRRTFQIWNDHADRAYYYYGFGDPNLIKQLEERILETEKRVAAAQAEGNVAESEEGRRRVADYREQIAALNNQSTRLEEIYEGHKRELQEWLDANRSELIAHFATADRVEGFARDGDSRSAVVSEVAGLRSQLDSIVSDRYRQLQGWKQQVTAIWDSYENQVAELAVGTQAAKVPLKLHRPFDQENSRLKWINWFIPWFDTVVGGLLMIGLFTRFTGIVAGLFLLSVIASQPPWIAGTTPTYFQSIEMVALFFLAGVGAGRMAGLDFFLGRRSSTTSAV